MTDTAQDQDTFPFGFTDDSERTVQRRVPTLPAPPSADPGPATARTPDDAIFRPAAATQAAAVAPTAVLEVPAEPTEEERKLAPSERPAARPARRPWRPLTSGRWRPRNRW